ncbi:MAG: cytochrome c [Acidobacteriota bacterium]
MSPDSKTRMLILTVWLPVIAAALVSPLRSVAGDDRDLARRARAVLAQRCFACHGLNGVARKNVFVLDRDRLVSSRTVVSGDVNSLLLKMVESGAMPLSGPQLADDEKATLRAWVLAGAPRFEDGAANARRFLSESAILAQLRADVEVAPDRTRPYLRYFSLANLYNARVSDLELESYRSALSKLINSLSRHSEITPPSAIDSARVLFRIDLRDYNWTLATWNTLVAAYPYSVRTSDGDSLARITGSPIPYLRADWFVTEASVAPLYYDVLDLPRTVQDLERQLGIDAARDLAEEKNVSRAGIRESGVSRNNRILERHVSQHGAYWKSFDFRTNLDDQNIFRDPLRFNAAGHEIIFNLPNGLQAYFLADARGSRLNSAPINIVADRNNADDPTIRNARSCMSCHFGGIQSFKDDVRAVVGGLSADRFDRQTALVLYPPQEVLERLVEKDRKRFEVAIAKTGAAPVPVSAQHEQINALSRKYTAELSVAEAASEAGLETPEFLIRLTGSSRLASLGFGQLVVSGGGIKRDAWERQFGDLVRELRLGDHVPRRNSIAERQGPFAQPLSPASTQFQLAGKRLAPALGRTVNTSRSVDALRFAQTIFIMSRSGYFNPSDLANEFMKKPDFSQLGLSLTKARNEADLVIEVDRLAFTTEFPYVVVDTKNNTVVASGQVNSLFGTAPAKMAKAFLNQLKATRAP